MNISVVDAGLNSHATRIGVIAAPGMVVARIPILGTVYPWVYPALCCLKRH